MLKQRVASAIISIPLVLAITWVGGWPFLVLIILASHLSLRELYLLTRQEDRVFRMCGFGGNLILLTLLFTFGLEIYFFALIIYFLLIQGLFVFTFPRDLSSLTMLFWGVIYITTLLGFFLPLRTLPAGFQSVLAVFLAIWASDTGAYFVGLSIGKHRLAPSVSPKKSVEGACGGLLFASLILFLLAPQLGMPRGFALVFGFLLSIAGQIGDLAESALKRWANVKDSGTFLPGHGGILDRLDSMLFAAPLAYLLLNSLLR